MTVAEILQELETLGNEKMRLHNKKHGAHDNQFGVKMGDIRKLAETIKTNHELARALWETSNIEARLLATLITIPKALSATELDSMVRSERFTQVLDWLYACVIKEHPNTPAMVNF